MKEVSYKQSKNTILEGIGELKSKLKIRKGVNFVEKNTVESARGTCAESAGTVASIEVSSLTVWTVMLWCWVVTSSTSMMSTVCAARRPRRPRRPAAVNCDAHTTSQPHRHCHHGTQLSIHQKYGKQWTHKMPVTIKLNNTKIHK